MVTQKGHYPAYQSSDNRDEVLQRLDAVNGRLPMQTAAAAASGTALPNVVFKRSLRTKCQ